MRLFKNKLLLGLTGGFGSGKSTVLRTFKELGAVTLDADAIVHSLLIQKQVIKRISQVFGKESVDQKGQLVRRYIASQVFSNKRRRKILEGILHPLVRSEMKKKIDQIKYGVVVCDVPLLYEKRWSSFFDAVIVVKVTRLNQEMRLLKKGFTLADIKARLKAQWPLSQKIKRATFVIDNNGTTAQTKRQIHLIWKALLSVPASITRMRP